MRLIDCWLGVPVCFVLTCWRRLFGRHVPDTPRQPRSILFIKLSEQGSTVLAQDALRAAIAKVGHRNVYFLVFAENRPILDLLDLVPPQNIIIIDAQGLWRAVISACRAIRQIWQLKIGAVIDLEFFARSSAALAYLSGATSRVGYHAFKRGGPYRGDLMTHRLSFNPYLHTSQAFRIMVEALEHSPVKFPVLNLRPSPPALPSRPFVADESEIAAVRELIRQQAKSSGDPRLILLNANASDLMPLRKWPSERYVELARRLLEQFAEIIVAFTGAPPETDAIEKLVQQVGCDRSVSVAGKTSLRQLMALYSLAEVLVTNDSGPAHFASLTSIDVVVLFGPETPRLFAAPSPRTHPIWAGIACSPCINAFNNRNSACRDNVCMQEITVDQVLAKVTEVCESRRKKAQTLPFEPLASSPLSHAS
jgi:ADP-heptose:LPS heptosyltransferase